MGILQLDQIIETYSDPDQPGSNYTIRLTPPESDEFSIEYLVLVATDNGYIAYIMQYLPDESQFGKSLRENYTGEINILDLERNLRSNAFFENGVQLDDSSENGRTNELICECKHVLKYSHTTSGGGANGLGTMHFTVVGVVCECVESGGAEPSEGSDGSPVNIGTPIPDDGESFGEGGGGAAGGGQGEIIGFEGLELEECNPGFSKDENGNCVIDCPPGTDNFNGECMVKCDGGGARAENGVCKDECHTSIEDLKEVFPNTSNERLGEVMNLINEYGKDFGLDTQAELQHFLTQAGHESKDAANNFDEFERLDENLNYSISALGVSKWTDYFNPSDDPYRDPTKMNPNLFKRTSDPSKADKSKLANLVYNDNKRKPRNKLGNTDHGDGFKYRGRGIFQLTGEYNYTQFNTFYRGNYDSSVNLLWNPGLLQTNTKIAVISALWFYQNKVLNKVGVDENTDPDDVSELVNGGNNGLEERRKLFNEKAVALINCN